jgi:hypothetical protein
MRSDENREVDFILVHTMTPREVVCLLLNRFPVMRDLVSPDEDCFEDPFHVYDSFARVVIERSNDHGFIQSVVLFIEELTEGKGPLIYEVLMSSLLEGIAENEQVARMISRRLSPRSRILLQEVESKIYGRTPSAEKT